MRGQFQADGGTDFIARKPSRRVRRHRALLGIALVPLFIGIVFVAVSPVAGSQASRSSYVQSHGARRSAVIVNVHNITSKSTITTGSGTKRHSRTYTTYSADILLSLAEPVSGQARTTLHVNHYDNGKPGDVLTVLVDPKDPGYAELPGSPETPSFLAPVFLGVGLFLIVAAGVGLAFIRRSWRRSRFADV